MYIPVNLKQRHLIGALLASSLVAGCATDGNNIVTDAGSITRSTENLSADQRKLVELEKKGAEIRLIAGGIGLAAGYFLSRLACDKKEEGLKKTLCVAGITGGTALAAYNGGAYLAAKREDAEQNRDNLESSLAAANEAVAYYEERVTVAQKVTSQHRKRISELNRSYRSQSILKEAYVAEYDEMRRDRSAIKSFVDQSQGDVDFMQREIDARVQGGVSAASLIERRNRLISRNAELTEQLNELDAALSSAPDEVRNA